MYADMDSVSISTFSDLLLGFSYRVQGYFLLAILIDSISLYYSESILELFEIFGHGLVNTGKCVTMHLIHPSAASLL